LVNYRKTPYDGFMWFYAQAMAVPSIDMNYYN